MEVPLSPSLALPRIIGTTATSSLPGRFPMRAAAAIPLPAPLVIRSDGIPSLPTRTASRMAAREIRSTLVRSTHSLPSGAWISPEAYARPLPAKAAIPFTLKAGQPGQHDYRLLRSSLLRLGSSRHKCNHQPGYLQPRLGQ